MNSFRSQLNIGDQHAKFIHERITNIERNAGDLCESLGAYTRQAARMRDRTDDLVVIVNQYAASESINQSLQGGLQSVAKNYAAIGDHRDAFVRRLETHVVAMFAPIGSQCKDIRDEVKATFAVRDREISRRKQVDKLKQRNPRNRQKILLAETDLARASADVSRSLRTLEEHMDAFESQKLSTNTVALRSLLKAELALHAREIELLTKAYAELALVDEQQDLEAFRSAVRSIPQEIPGKSALRETLRSSLAGLFSSSNAPSSSYSGLRANSAPATPTATIPSSPISRTVSLHGDDEENEDTDSSTSEETSTSDRESVIEPRKQRPLVTQPKFLRGYK
ncbi:hypothetical protein B566_EDAN000753 [Ephemera danica]|nr:hypothetical protein B566_EDAN000753 [Ephemera danica]